MAKSFAENLADDGGSDATNQSGNEGEVQEETTSQAEASQRMLSDDDGGQQGGVDAGDAGGGEQQGDTSQDTDAGPSILDRVRALGIEVDDEASALPAMLDQFGEWQGQVRQIVQQNNDLVAQNRQWQEYIRSQGATQQPAPADTQTDTTDTPWRSVKPLEVTDRELAVWQDENGEFKQGTPPEIIREVARFREQNQRFFHDLATDPGGTLGPGIEAIVSKILDDRLVQHDRQRDTRSQYERIAEAVQERAYAADPLTGEPVLTEYGQRFSNAYSQALNRLKYEFGDGDERRLKQFAFTTTYELLHPMFEEQASGASAAATGGNGSQATTQQGASGNGQQTESEKLREQRRREHTRQRRASSPTQTGGASVGNDGARGDRKTNRLLTAGQHFADLLNN